MVVGELGGLEIGAELLEVAGVEIDFGLAVGLEVFFLGVQGEIGGPTEVHGAVGVIDSWEVEIGWFIYIDAAVAVDVGAEQQGGSDALDKEQFFEGA